MRMWKWAWGCCCVELFEALCRGLIAGVVLQDGEGLGGGLAIGAEEGDAVAVACGVDADTDAVERTAVVAWKCSGA